VEEVDGAVGEEPGVEGPRQPGDVVRRQGVPLVPGGQLLEQLQGLEDEVEVVPGEVVQEELHVLRRRLRLLAARHQPQLLRLPAAAGGDRAEHLGDDEERVKPRRAAEVSSAGARAAATASWSTGLVFSIDFS